MRIAKPPVIIRMLLGFLATVFCFLLVLSLSLTILIADVRVVMTDSENVKSIISGLLFDAPRPARPMTPGLAVGVTPKLEDAQGGTNEITDMILDALYDLLEENMDDDAQFTVEDVKTFLEQSTLLDFLSDKVAGIVTDIYMGELTTTLTREEVEQQLYANLDLIEQSFGYRFTDKEIQQICDEVDKMDVIGEAHKFISESLGTDAPDAPVVDEEGNIVSGTVGGNQAPTKQDTSLLGGIIAETTQIAGFFNTVMSGGEITVADVVSVTRSVSSTSYLYAGIALCVILVALICLCNYYQPHVGIRVSGIMALLAGALFAVPTFAMGSLSGMNSMLDTVINVMNMTMGVNLVVLGIGAAMVVISIFWGIALKTAKAPAKKTAPVLEHTPAPVAEAEPEAEPCNIPEPTCFSSDDKAPESENCTTDDICKKY